MPLPQPPPLTSASNHHHSCPHIHTHTIKSFCIFSIFFFFSVMLDRLWAINLSNAFCVIFLYVFNHIFRIRCGIAKAVKYHQSAILLMEKTIHLQYVCISQASNPTQVVQVKYHLLINTLTLLVLLERVSLTDYITASQGAQAQHRWSYALQGLTVCQTGTPFSSIQYSKCIVHPGDFSTDWLHPFCSSIFQCMVKPSDVSFPLTLLHSVLFYQWLHCHTVLILTLLVCYAHLHIGRNYAYFACSSLLFLTHHL